MKQIERAASVQELLAARGWLSCYIPLGATITADNEDLQVVVRIGNLAAAVERIDRVLKQLGHKTGRKQ